MTKGEEIHKQIGSVTDRPCTIRRKSGNATNAVRPGKKVSQEIVLRACLQITPSVNLISHISCVVFLLLN